MPIEKSDTLTCTLSKTGVKRLIRFPHIPSFDIPLCCASGKEVLIEGIMSDKIDLVFHVAVRLGILNLEAGGLIYVPQKNLLVGRSTDELVWIPRVPGHFLL